MNNWSGVYIVNPIRTMGKIVPPEIKKDTWAEKEVWRLRGIRKRFKINIAKLKLTLITIFIIIPLVLLMAVAPELIFPGRINEINMIMWGLVSGFLDIYYF
jgi:hypothetical protein